VQEERALRKDEGCLGGRGLVMAAIGAMGRVYHMREE